MLDFKIIQMNYAPLELSGYGAFAMEPSSNRNPFVKIGDKVKLFSQHGTFRVLNITDTYFVVSNKKSTWFIKRIYEYKCGWEDFRGWAGR